MLTKKCAPPFCQFFCFFLTQNTYLSLCNPAYGTLGQETRRGHWSAGSGGLVALRRTDDGGRTMYGTRHWRGAAEYSFMDGEEEKGRKERGDGQDVR